MLTATYLSKDRPNHLKRSICSLFEQTVKPSHIVVVDCSDNREPIEIVINELNIASIVPITLVWKPKEELSRSQGRSLGRQYVKTPVMVSTESDILFPPTLVERCLEAFGNPPQKVYIQPYWVYQNEKEQVPPTPTHYKGGFFQTYRTEDFDAIGGYNPFLKGWGWEDNDFDERILAYGCKHVIIPLTVIHMWHVTVANGASNEKNMQIAKRSHWDNDKKQWFMGDLCQQ
jgi:hypothetical protein